jgi:hypothetical protein
MICRSIEAPTIPIILGVCGGGIAAMTAGEPPFLT